MDTTVKTQIPALGLRHGHYFNADAMYIDVKNWLAANIQQAALNRSPRWICVVC
ncbi:hypothetical protein ACTMU2_39450 [Cupriavidus basilensis]